MRSHIEPCPNVSTSPACGEVACLKMWLFFDCGQSLLRGYMATYYHIILSLLNIESHACCFTNDTVVWYFWVWYHTHRCIWREKRPNWLFTWSKHVVVSSYLHLHLVWFPVTECIPIRKWSLEFGWWGIYKVSKWMVLVIILCL